MTDAGDVTPHEV